MRGLLKKRAPHSPDLQLYSLDAQLCPAFVILETLGFSLVILRRILCMIGELIFIVSRHGRYAVDGEFDTYQKKMEQN